MLAVVVVTGRETAALDVAPARKELQMKKILLAYDGGEPARRALDQTIEFARAMGAEVGVVSVVPVHPGRSPIDPWDDRSVHAEELLEARKLLREAGIEATMIEPGGDDRARRRRAWLRHHRHRVPRARRDRPDPPGERLGARRRQRPRHGRRRSLMPGTTPVTGPSLPPPHRAGADRCPPPEPTA